jgi:hypothetical protein
LTVQLRYRSAAVAVADVERPDGQRSRVAAGGDEQAPFAGQPSAGGLLVRLAAPFAAPAPGQAAVFYRGDVVVGAGVIAAAVAPSGPGRAAQGREYDSVS